MAKLYITFIVIKPFTYDISAIYSQVYRVSLPKIIYTTALLLMLLDITAVTGRTFDEPVMTSNTIPPATPPPPPAPAPQQAPSVNDVVAAASFPSILTVPLATIPPPQSSLEAQQAAVASTCFYADIDLCLQPSHHRDNADTSTSTCTECFPHPTVPNSLVCCNVTDIEKSIACVPNPTTMDNSTVNQHHWVNVHIYNATVDELDFSLKHWKRLDSLVVTDGHINRIVKEFTKFSSPQCINISNNNLLVIHPRAFRDLVQLQVLDISHNNLSTMPNLNSIPTNLSLYIRGNSAMLCKSVLELMDRGGMHFVDSEAAYCLTNQTFDWFNSTDSIPLRQLEKLKQLKMDCPYIPGYGNCTCEAERMPYEVRTSLALLFLFLHEQFLLSLGAVDTLLFHSSPLCLAIFFFPGGSFDFEDSRFHGFLFTLCLFFAFLKFLFAPLHILHSSTQRI